MNMIVRYCLQILVFEREKVEVMDQVIEILKPLDFDKPHGLDLLWELGFLTFGNIVILPENMP